MIVAVNISSRSKGNGRLNVIKAKESPSENSTADSKNTTATVPRP